MTKCWIWGLLAFSLLVSACSTSEVQPQSEEERAAAAIAFYDLTQTAAPSRTPTITPSPSDTPTTIPSPTNTPTATPKSTDTPTPTATPILADVGDTYFDKELGYDVYFDGMEFVDQYTYIVNRLRNGGEAAICAPCAYGGLVADQRRAQKFILQFWYGLSKWDANNDLYVSHGIDTSTIESFNESILQNGIPEGLLGPSPGRIDYSMNAFIPAGVNLEKVIIEIYGDDQLGPVKYMEGPLKMRDKIVVYNIGNQVQLGFGILDVDGEKYLRRVLILGSGREFTRNNALFNNVAERYQHWMNRALHHFTTLAEYGQLQVDEGTWGPNELWVNFWSDRDPERIGSGWGKSFSPHKDVIPILKPKT